MSKYTNTISAFQFMELIPTEEHARKHIEKLLWGDYPVCPVCNNSKKGRIYKNKTREGFYRCKDCRKIFTVRVNTIFESSKIDLRKWLYAMYLTLTARKGISSYQLSKEVGVTQKTAWFIEHRIRKACETGSLGKLSGIVELDEAYFGGKESNKHSNKKIKEVSKGMKTWYSDKGVVLGMKSRDGEFRGKAMYKASKGNIKPAILKNIEQGSTLSTDENKVYSCMVKHNYKRISVNHSVGEFIKGMASTNGVESMWAILKRGYHGTYHHISAKHLQKYIDEFTFRLNEGSCKIHTWNRIESLCKAVKGKRLTYKELTS